LASDFGGEVAMLLRRHSVFVKNANGQSQYHIVIIKWYCIPSGVLCSAAGGASVLPRETSVCIPEFAS
jgi:hypothetical protein